MAIISIPVKTLETAHQFLLEENIADEEFVQFLFCPGIVVVLRVSVGKAADLKQRFNILEGRR